MSPSDEILQFFSFEHLRPPLREISEECAKLAFSMTQRLGESREMTAGLRKLLEAKDCFVRAALPRLESPSENLVRKSDTP